ncbi:MAG: hypothetical protein ABFR90_06865 [Planctomycetota bacterium]
MRNFRTSTAVAGLLLLQSLLIASPQWLQYRTSDRTRDIVGGSRGSVSRFLETPSELKLPEMSTDKPKFIKWNTAMDKQGFRWVVLDKKHKYGLCDILYIDSDGDGRLDDEQKHEGRQTNQYEVEFAQVPVYFEGEDGPITYHLNLRYFKYDKNNERFYASAGCWYEGDVMIGGEKTRCVLVDYNCNGTFNDKSEDFNCDRILIGPEGSHKQLYMGNYLEYEDALYRPNIAKDGANVEITSAPDVAYGEVEMPASITSFTAGGLNGMFTRSVKDGKVQLPAGQYRIFSWEIVRKDDKGAEWKVQGQWLPEGNEFEVAKDSAANLDIGEPFFSKLDARMRNKSHYFNQGLVGKHGERISLYKNNNRPSAPKVHIRNKTGEYDRTFALEYG